MKYFFIVITCIVTGIAGYYGGQFYQQHMIYKALVEKEHYSRDRSHNNLFRTLAVTGTLYSETIDCREEGKKSDQKDKEFNGHWGVDYLGDDGRKIYKCESYGNNLPLQHIYTVYYIKPLQAIDRTWEWIYLGYDLPTIPSLDHLVNDGKEHTFWVKIEHPDDRGRVNLHYPDVEQWGLLQE